MSAKEEKAKKHRIRDYALYIFFPLSILCVVWDACDERGFARALHLEPPPVVEQPMVASLPPADVKKDGRIPMSESAYPPVNVEQEPVPAPAFNALQLNAALENSARQRVAHQAPARRLAHVTKADQAGLAAAIEKIFSPAAGKKVSAKKRHPHLASK